MKKYQVNHASVATGPFGSFGNLLVNPVGHSEEQEVSKVVIRTTPEVAKAVAEKLAELKGTGKVLTTTAEFSMVNHAKGEVGFKLDQWKDKATGENREQLALYIRFASTPVWAREDGKNDIGNIADV